MLLLLAMQEIVGLGLANFAGSAFNAYSTTGSFSRSAVNYDSGRRNQHCCSTLLWYLAVIETNVFGV